VPSAGLEGTTRVVGSRRRLAFLVVGMAVVGISVVFVTTLVLYRAAFQGQRARLVDTARSRARLIESVAEFDRQYSRGLPGGAAEATISQIITAHERFEGFDGTGEFTLARQVGDSIVFLLAHGHTGIVVPDATPVTSHLAEPMRRALQGESGTVVGYDYRGVMVLAAYEHTEGLGLGVVAKVDVSEIRAPFIRAAMWALGACVVLIGIGAILFRAIMEPLVSDVWTSEQKFRSLFERSLDAIAIVNTDGSLEDGNEALYDLLGYERGELSGKNVRSLYADPELRQDFIDAIYATGSVKDFEASLRRRDGSEIDCLLTAVTRHGPKEEHAGHVTIIRDVTETKRVEALLRIQATMLSSMADAVITTNPDFSITGWNRGAERMYGWRAEEVLGKTLPEVVEIEYPQKKTRDEVIEDFRAHGYWSGEVVHTTREGRRMRVLSVVTQVDDDQGEPVGVVAVNRDITKRVQMEEAMKASEAESRGLFENAPYGIYRSTTDGRFTAVNPALVRMLRYDSAEELLQVDIAEDLYVDPTERSRSVLQQTTTANGFYEEALWQRKDGKRITVALKGRSIFGSDDTIVGFEAMAEDVTEQRQLESQLRQAQKMEAIGQLTGGIAHDFNNELLVILLNTQMLAEGIERGEKPRKDEINDIKEAAQRAAEITQQLVGFSRQAALKRVPTNLAMRVTRMSSMLSRILPANIQVKTEADDTVSSVSVDPNSVEQMLLNLTTNAQHAMPDGGELTVRVWEDSLDQKYCERYPPTTPGRYVLLSVTDTGSGMDEEVRAKIFEPFFTTRPVGEGTGLGMAMVYGLTKQQQGFVHVDSQPGNGTSVRLAFPVVEEPAATITAEYAVANGSASRGKETVLFVDDEEALRRVGRRVLESHGFTVVTAQDGIDALEKIQSGRYEFDLIITDLMMPNMGGVELCSTMQRLGVRLPVILASGHTHTDIPNQLVRESTISFIRKPWDVTGMLAAVRRALDT